MKNIIIAVIFGITFTQSAFSAGGGGSGADDECFVTSASDCTYPDLALGDPTYCDKVNVTCYIDLQNKRVAVYDCNGCKNNAKGQLDWGSINGCSGDVSFNTCICSGTCTNCNPDTNWVSAGSGYEQKAITATCECGTCVKTYQYRCATGYYGSPGSAASGCSPCPDGGSSSAGSASINNCYITGAFSDSTGSGTYTGKCYYN